MTKYKSYPLLSSPNRSWPDKKIEQAPIWCSVDLRDGNQALIDPMDVSQKLSMFELLVEIGFKEIEVGFPSASDTEFAFMRELIESERIPADVTPQILTQAREHLIRRSFESLQGAKRAIVHLYNSTSELQRRVVFGMDKSQIKQIAIDGTLLIKELAKQTDTEIIFQYSPESFTGTELDYALEVCEAVIDSWNPSTDHKMILNLPATVEMSTPNIYADQIEWFVRNLKRRDQIILSLHTHNDRGTGVAATELALMAGADRVEGTLFGNGERTGNVDIITLALNLFTQGVDPKLNFKDIEYVRKIYEENTGMTVHERHPYSGSLVFTAFSGSHQDAIRKGIAARKANNSELSNNELWEVPYLPIDPTDIGRSYEAIIRINSQSGKGGVAFIMESEFGCYLPKAMHPEFSAIIQKYSDTVGREVLAEEIWKEFSRHYLERNLPLELVSFDATRIGEKAVSCKIELLKDGKPLTITGKGNGPIDSCKNALLTLDIPHFNIIAYFEHALTSGAHSQAISYIQIGSSPYSKNMPTAGASKMTSKFGAGIDSDITLCSVKGLISAVNCWLGTVGSLENS
jgi:2-isopropylmalate synthase